MGEWSNGVLGERKSDDVIAPMTETSHNSPYWFDVPPMLRNSHRVYVNQFDCCPKSSAVVFINPWLLVHYDVISTCGVSLYPKQPRSQKEQQLPTNSCKESRAAQDVWLGCAWPKVELLLNGAVGGASGQFKSVSDSLMPLLEQRWGVVLSLAGCRRAESRAWHV